MFGHNHAKQGFLIMVIALAMMILATAALAGALHLMPATAGKVCYVASAVLFVSGILVYGAGDLRSHI